MPLTIWNVERTGGNCDADVARLTDDGEAYVVVVTADEGHAYSTRDTSRHDPHRFVIVNVYRSGGWDGDDDDRDPVASAEAPLGRYVYDESYPDGEVWLPLPVDILSLIRSALSEASISLRHTDILSLASALR